MPEFKKQKLHDIEKTLSSVGIENAYMESRWIVEHVLGIDATLLTTTKSIQIQEKQIVEIDLFVLKRESGTPLAYVLGEVPFHNINVTVNEHVLIPRAETEELVEICLNKIYKQKKGKFLDLCCGSGCIAISIGKEMREWKIDMSDIDKQAIEICKINIEKNIADESKKNFETITSDLFKCIPQQNKYDLIVCNPPYIYPDEKKDMHVSVLDYEPHLALFHEDPVHLFKDIFMHSSRQLNASGNFLAELSPRIASEVFTVAKEYFLNTRILKDMSGKDRFIHCQEAIT